MVTRRRKVQYFRLLINQESATAIEGISTGEAYIPTFLILLKKVHISN